MDYLFTCFISFLFHVEIEHLFSDSFVAFILIEDIAWDLETVSFFLGIITCIKNICSACDKNSVLGADQHQHSVLEALQIIWDTT